MNRDHVCDSGRISLADPSMGGRLGAACISRHDTNTQVRVCVDLPRYSGGLQFANYFRLCCVLCVGWGAPLKGPDPLITLVPWLRAPGRWMHKTTRGELGLGGSDRTHRVLLEACPHRNQPVTTMEDPGKAFLLSPVHQLVISEPETQTLWAQRHFCQDDKNLVLRFEREDSFPLRQLEGLFRWG